MGAHIALSAAGHESIRDPVRRSLFTLERVECTGAWKLTTLSGQIKSDWVCSAPRSRRRAAAGALRQNPRNRFRFGSSGGIGLAPPATNLGLRQAEPRGSWNRSAVAHGNRQRPQTSLAVLRRSLTVFRYVCDDDQCIGIGVASGQEIGGDSSPSSRPAHDFRIL
jgi:hypothetical protein